MFGLLGSFALAAYATGGPTATQPQTAREEEPYSPWVCIIHCSRTLSRRTCTCTSFFKHELNGRTARP